MLNQGDNILLQSSKHTPSVLFTAGPAGGRKHGGYSSGMTNGLVTLRPFLYIEVMTTAPKSGAGKLPQVRTARPEQSDETGRGAPDCTLGYTKCLPLPACDPWRIFGNQREQEEWSGNDTGDWQAQTRTDWHLYQTRQKDSCEASPKGLPGRCLSLNRGEISNACSPSRGMVGVVYSGWRDFCRYVA